LYVERRHLDGHRRGQLCRDRDEGGKRYICVCNVIAGDGLCGLGHTIQPGACRLTQQHQCQRHIHTQHERRQWHGGGELHTRQRPLYVERRHLDGHRRGQLCRDRDEGGKRYICLCNVIARDGHCDFGRPQQSGCTHPNPVRMGHDLDGQLDGDVRFCAHAPTVM